ncbi:conserved hypothetical protein [Streptomyces viridochromogenes DSM 40736]|uniref:DUF6879 domain-containing protein n=1 Tax=Streptomyces viridochromogenes (strain DSM 40736 / JCM 4977 / BCRC 1201 / Tue 494) TaxID=591159 RepID=D9X0A4_STRVT|nr:DUF6879 family protein [Streptomyces viridochromogenes]EFL35488.1 conserved hypothetical protein [Streptomyces viridochromogenes DSM 40736]
MARNIRFNGTGSGDTGCPSVHEDLNTGEVIVHGPPLTDPADVAQLQHLGPGEVAVVVPRELLADWAPRDATRQARMIGLDAFNGLFETFRHTAWRLETRRRYASDETTATYAQFQAEGRVDWDMSTWYCTTIRQATATGKTVSRVRLLDDPPTPGQRYLLCNAERNAALGEDIRTLSRSEAEWRHLGSEDFWIFDSRLVARLDFTDADELTGVELITEPAEVVRYARLRDAAWHHATPN